MIQVIPAQARHSVDLGWLRSSLSFSFGEYFDPENCEFSALRVFNDDTIAPGRGFGAHPHSDMEIVTLVLKGSIKHEDSLGHTVVSTVGELQRMTAGTGVIHAEYNNSDTEEGSFLQLWFMPRERGLRPSYEAGSFDRTKLVNTLLPIVTPDGADGTALIHQDLTIYLSRLEPGHSLTYEQAAGRRMYLFVIEGEATANGTMLNRRDSARIAELTTLNLQSEQGGYIMLIDLP
ncbi:pirin family protein [Paenibacillaceae bacterium]|nr:pirin family protein [Paenibacillaceae bacterium]